jgi:thiamine kinase-like enzyme
MAPPDRVEEAARRYVPGVGAVSVERLGRGLVNESHRVLRDGRLYSLRMPAAEPAVTHATAHAVTHAAAHVPIGVDREWECRVLAVASAAGIAPVIERCEPRLGVLVARWEEGHMLTASEARRPEMGARVAQLARRVHALTPPGNARALRPADWIEQYRDALARLPVDTACASRGRGQRASPERLQEEAQRLQEEAARRLGSLEAFPRGPGVLCHSDLHRANLVASERGLVLLDWEYAHVSEALWDVAGWACNNDLEREARALLLASYLGRPAQASEERRLDDLAWLYDYVCLLWSELYCGAKDASDRRILERGRALASRLGARMGGGPDELPAN